MRANFYSFVATDLLNFILNTCYLLSRSRRLSRLSQKKSSLDLFLENIWGIQISEYVYLEVSAEWVFPIVWHLMLKTLWAFHCHVFAFWLSVVLYFVMYEDMKNEFDRRNKFNLGSETYLKKRLKIYRVRRKGNIIL